MDKDLSAARARLTRENKRLILKIEQYLESHYINEVTGEELISDIVGMARECQKRGERFEDALGGDSEAFCRELIRHAPRQSLGERILHILRWIVMYATLLLPGLFLFEWVFPTVSPATISGAEYTVSLSFLIKYLILVLVLVVGWFIVRMYTYKPTKYVLGGYLASFMLVFLFSDAFLSLFIHQQVAAVNVLLWLLIGGVALLLCDLLRRLVATSIAYKNRKKNEKNES